MSFAMQNFTAGQLNAIVKKLGGEEAARKFLRGVLEVTTAKNVVDLDAAPFCPDGWEVLKHNGGESIKLNPGKISEQISLFLTEEQSSGSYNMGYDLRFKVEGMSPFNANLLDYLLAHPDLIPDEWKEKWVFFWGTIYRRPSDRLYVRCLCWKGGDWDWDCRWLDGIFGANCPSAVRIAA